MPRRNNNCEQCTTHKREIKTKGKKIQQLFCALQAALRTISEDRIARIVIDENEDDELENVPLNERARAIELRQAKIRSQVTDLVERVTNIGAPTEASLEGLTSCGICFERYNDGQCIPLTIMCGHVLCITCMSKLQSLKCPHCRKEIKGVVRMFV